MTLAATPAMTGWGECAQVPRAAILTRSRLLESHPIQTTVS